MSAVPVETLEGLSPLRKLRIAATIELRAYEVGKDVLSAPEVVLRLGDTGQGMSPDVLARLFEPYFTTKADGLGVGLSISRSIVESHGGSIGVANLPKGGARFDVTFPLD